ncbi:hypothetical protein PHLCEN_2v9818 [Hermanssonia centrifuga]|uniref:Uncharacterized protein n=1 Tax=Hermanssonia centrifuga TaxID=98765 RepID=A0A2R6NPT6_9APHY|nr:hypothetical protein PHLCEN_2v9818 [Hermanssonia centrifuga]
MALLLVSIGQATDKDFEHDWYHPYDWTLNFNACRWTKAKDGDYRFSVYPQARLAGLPVEIAKSSNDITIGSRAQRGTGVEPEGSGSHTIAKNLAQLRVSPSSEAASEAGPSRVIAGTSSQQQDGALRRSERLLLLHSEGSEKQERPTKRPPVSTASTVPAVAKSLDEYTRYPDFVVTMISSGGLDSLHSIWELKRPSDGLKMRSPADDCMDAYALDEFNVHLLQVIEQVECAFSVYRHQNKMFVFLALGCWLRYIRFSRNKMPSKETLDAARVPGLKGREIVALLRPYARQSPPFYLLNEQESDYSSLFKSY